LKSINPDVGLAIFSERKTSLDSIIVSKGLYDNKGISYVDNSFDKFDPDYLFRKTPFTAGK